QKIQGYLVAREEDTFTGIKAQLKVKIDGMDQLLFNDTTGDSGYISFRLQIPGDLSPGSHVLDFRLSPLPGDLYHQECTLVKTAVIQEQTTIMHQQSSYLVRKQNSWFNATVVDSHGLPVNAGSLSLQLNGEIIHESTGSSTNYLFTVPSTVSRGINSFTWQYSGSEYYAAKEQVFPLAVFSVPSFENLGSSHGEIIPGDEIELTGQLVEETGDGIGGATVTVNHRDNWGNVTQYSVLTEAGGNFSFQLVVESENIGFHTFTLQFNGWTDEYYLPIEWKPVFEINVKLPITLIVKNQLVAGENASLEFQGKPSAEIKLEILDNGEFHKLSIFVLDSQGKYVYAWDIPENARGDIFLRAGYITSDEKVIFSLQVKVRPQIDLNVSKLLYLVDEEVEFLVSSSEKHDIWLDGEIWQDDLSAGSRLFTLVFTESGDHLLEVIASGEDVIETVLNASFLVREDYLVTINLPARVQRGVDIVAAIAIENSDKQPLEGFKISLFIDDQVMATAVTSQAGSSTMTFTLTTGFYRPVLKITPREEGIHYLKEIELEGLTVYSVPVIEISDVQPIKGRTVIVKIKVLDVLSPVAGETVSVLLKSTIDNSTVELGTNVTDMEGITRITWSVTQESGDYLLQVKNTGSQFVEPIITTKTVHINGQGPEIIQASVLVQEEQKNRYIVTAIIDFPGGKRGVYLYSGKNGEIIGELVETGSTWTLIFQLEKGSHDLWVQAVDNQDIDTWKDLGTVTVLTDLPESSESTNPGTTGSLIDTIRDTTITMVFILPVAGLIAYKKRKSYTRS
ncbi:MAG: carboxypeptidase-like regulatory domain-containing protein, partial [Candidatus Odinarchaeota archaeon]